MKLTYPTWIIASLLLAGSAQSAASQNFRLNLVTLSPVECGAEKSVPAECINRGSDLCKEQNGQMIEMVTQFDENTREVANIWFQCAVTAEVSE